jgi:protocatechuate 3,4-dioxygenase beta subunit
MNNLATPFASSFLTDFLNTIAGRSLTHGIFQNALRSLPFRSALQSGLAFICLLGFTANFAVAQEAAATQMPAAERAAPSATGSITGRVVADDGRPLSDAVIFLNRAFARLYGPPLTATTDSDGRFRASGLDSGLFMVSAQLPGFTTPDVLPEPGETNYYKPGDTVNLTLIKGGVITGTVRDSNGEPVVAVAVRALRVRDGLGRTEANRINSFFPERLTDDRGVYRIYGLPPGVYTVSAGSSQRLFGTFNAYESDAPTYFPSSTRDTAAEVPLRGGEEATGIDIRYRGERGHTISGTVSGFIETSIRSGVSITLRHRSSGAFEGNSFVVPGAKPGFTLNGVSDGEYEVTAQQFAGTSDSAASLPRRVTVKGADLTGIDLALLPLASISGRVQLEAPPKEKCEASRSSGATLLETLISARRDEKNKPGDIPGPLFFATGGSLATEQGEFAIRNLMPGSYRLTLRLPSDDWYVRSIALPNQAATPQPAAQAKTSQPKTATVAAAPVPASVVTLKSGERVGNVAVQIAQDAAALSGRVLSATEGAEGSQLPANLKVYLVPMERERADDVLRYAETALDSSGSFTFTNLAPGRYWVVARPASEAEGQERAPRQGAWDADTRAKLRREAEAARTTLELQPCKRASDYVLRYGAVK